MISKIACGYFGRLGLANLRLSEAALHLHPRVSHCISDMNDCPVF
jgi:hypothetical protein